MPSIHAAVLAAVLLAGLALALPGIYLVTLALAALLPQASVRRSPASTKVAVLVPAHNEEALVGRAVRSLIAQDYPANLFWVIVIADNCSDSTATVAREAGAAVWERQDMGSRGKGKALRWAMDRLLASTSPPDAIVVVDADSVADPGLLEALVARQAAGAEAVQAEYLVLAESDSARSRLVSAGFLLFHRVRLGGRHRLGLPTALVGNGMLFTRSLLERHPWDAFTGVEDLEYTIRLRLAGVRPRYAPDARVLGPMPGTYGAMTGQRVRWEGGRLHAMRRWLPLLWRHTLTSDPRTYDAALDLSVPPLGLLAQLSAAGFVLAAAAALIGLAPMWVLAPALGAPLLLLAFVAIGLIAGRAPAGTYLALIEVPRFLLWKVLTYARLVHGFDPDRWDRADRQPRTGEPVYVAGVRIDPVTLGQALDRVDEAISNRGFTQVATVNLDFLVQAQRKTELREILQGTALNIADGMPVVWLSKLMGRSLPGRTAGSDLVPQLMGRLAARGGRVFLLGGEHGVAAEAASRLTAAHPQLTIAGCFEPPRAAVDQMPNELIVRMINDSRPDVLLVAFGNPKQELWIARHRKVLRVPVAIGVGCTLDLIAGRARRAPRWMQRVGLEWTWRLGQEPRRLSGRYFTDGIWLARLALNAATGSFAHPI